MMRMAMNAVMTVFRFMRKIPGGLAEPVAQIVSDESEGC